MNTKFSFSNYIEITIASPQNEVEIISSSKGFKFSYSSKASIGLFISNYAYHMEKDTTISTCDFFTLEDIPRFCITFYVLLTFQSIL